MGVRALWRRYALVCSMWVQPAQSQSSLADQQYECSRLREEVAASRRRLDARARTSESYDRQINSTSAGARARGQSEAKIDHYRSVMESVRDSSGSVAD